MLPTPEDLIIYLLEIPYVSFCAFIAGFLNGLNIKAFKNMRQK